MLTSCRKSFTLEWALEELPRNFLKLSVLEISSAYLHLVCSLGCVFVFLCYKKTPNTLANLQKQNCLKIASLVVVGLIIYILLSVVSPSFFLNWKRPLCILVFLLQITESFNKILPFAVRVQSISYSASLLPSLEIFFDSRRVSIFALQGPWPPKGKAASPPWDPAFPRLSFPCPTRVLRISQTFECESCNSISASLLCFLT